MKRSKLLYSTLALLMLASPVLAEINDGLVAFYPFNGNAIEATGSGPNGTVVGATLTEDRYGNADSAYNFDGVNDYINLGNSLNFPAWDTYSVSLWFLHDGGGNTTTGYGQKILSKGQFKSDFHLQVSNPGYLYWWSSQGGWTSIGDTSYDYRDNTWHHVVINMFYVNANERWGEMWVDGILKVSGTLWKVTNAVDLLIGYTAHTDGNQQRYWSGKIDDISVYDRTLAETEIVELFSGVAGSQSNLVLCNTLESEEAILNSYVGPGGTFSGGSFASDSGLFGRNAYKATNSEDNLVTFPKEVIPANRGSIEFWAKLIDFPATVPPPQANTPTFFEINDTMGARYEIQIQSNDGVGGGGLVSRIGNVRVRTQGYGQVNYATLLGDPTDWHHFAASWDIDGLNIPGLGGTGTLAQWIDGVRVGDYFAGASSPQFPQPLGDVVKLIRNDLGGVNSVQMSNLKVWDFGKIHFFDRFVDCLPPAVPPTADAGDNQAIHAGVTVELNGSGSYDDTTPTENLLFDWNFVARPEGSTTVLNNPDTVDPTFVADLPGTYDVSLVVTDEDALSSDPSFVIISSLNTPPNADAGLDIASYVGNLLTLDGSGSNDPDEDPLTYLWVLANSPTGSTAQLIDELTVMPSITPDLVGSYQVDLTVNDGFIDSAPDSVTLVIITPEDFVQQETAETLNVVAALPPTSTTTNGNQQALTIFLEQTISQIQKGNVDEAIAILTMAIERTDGCVLRGSPDLSGAGGIRKDFVTNCDDQAVIYAQLVSALEALQ